MFLNNYSFFHTRVKVSKANRKTNRRKNSLPPVSHEKDDDGNEGYSEDEDFEDETRESESRFSKHSSAGRQRSYSPNVKIEVRRDPADSIQEPKTNSRFSINDNAKPPKRYDPNIRVKLPKTPGSVRSSDGFSKSDSGKSLNRYNRTANDRIVKKRDSISSGTSSRSSQRRDERTSSPILEDESERLSKSASSDTVLTPVQEDGPESSQDSVVSESNFHNPLDSERGSEGSRPSTQWRLSQSMNQLQLEQEKMKRRKLSQIDSIYDRKTFSNKGKSKYKK